MTKEKTNYSNAEPNKDEIMWRGRGCISAQQYDGVKGTLVYLHFMEARNVDSKCDNFSSFAHGWAQRGNADGQKIKESATPLIPCVDLTKPEDDTAFDLIRETAAKWREASTAFEQHGEDGKAALIVAIAADFEEILP